MALLLRRLRLYVVVSLGAFGRAQQNVFAALVALAASSSSCKRSKQPQPGQAPPSVVVAEVARKEIPVYAESVGQLEAFDAVEIRSRVGGILEEIGFREGSLVRKGDLLFAIDARPFEVAVRSADAQIAQAEAALYTAKRDVERYRPLVKARAISRQQLDQAQAAVLSAEAQRMLGRVALEKARLDLGYTRITSPLDGRIGRAGLKRGALVGAGTSLLATVVKIHPIHVYFSISEADFLSLESAQSGKPKLTADRVELILANGEKYSHAGTVDMREPRIDSSTGTLGIRAIFPNPEGHLLPGGFAQARLLVSPDKPTLVVPQRAVTELQENAP